MRSFAIGHAKHRYPMISLWGHSTQITWSLALDCIMSSKVRKVSSRSEPVAYENDECFDE